MIVNFAMHLDDFRGEPTMFMKCLHEYLPKDWRFHLVFRFPLDYLSKEEYKHIKSYFLYEHFSEELSEDEMKEAEIFLNKPFALIRMMSKVGVHRYPNISKLPDNNYFANMVRAWRKFFITRKISLFISGVGDDYSSLIGIEVAKRLGVKIIFLNSGRFSNSYLLTDENFKPIFYKNLCKKEIERAWLEAKKLILNEKVTNPELSKIVKREFDLKSPRALVRLIRGFFLNFKTYYFEIPKCDRWLWYSPLELISKRVLGFIRSQFSKMIFKYKAKYTDKYIFYPLHFTDDATITMKTPFIDQFELLRGISKTLFRDVYLYVKPHPHFRCTDIPISKMLRLSKSYNVKLLPYNADTKEIVSNALYTIVINSSVAFEAVIMGKPVVAFGRDYPNDVVPHITSPAQLLRAIPKVDERKVKEYVANCYAHSIFLNTPYYLKFDFSDIRDVHNIANAIVESYKFLCRRYH